MSAVSEMNVYGLPAPQGSHSAYVNKATGRAVMLQGSSTTGRAKHKEWRASVTDSARSWMAANGYETSPWDRDTTLFVQLYFRMPEPKGKVRRLLHGKRPDLDKLIRSTLDSLTASGLISDDSRCSMLFACKRYHAGDHPGVEIVIREAFDFEVQEVFDCLV